MHERRITTAAVRSILTCWLHSLAHSRFRCSCSATRTTEQDTDEGRQGHTVAHTVMHERRIATAAVRSISTCSLHSLAHSRLPCLCSATNTTETDTDDGRHLHHMKNTVMQERRNTTGSIRSISPCIYPTHAPSSIAA